MNREDEEFQFLGFLGIFKESFIIVSSWIKIFSQITVAMILPLSLIYLGHIQISQMIFSDIMFNEYIHDRIPKGTRSYDKISDILLSEWTAFFLFKIGYFIFFLILALLSTSAVVYTIASIYTANEIILKKVMKVVPKVWKRLMVTFIWNSLIVFAYNIVSILIFILWALLFRSILFVGTILLISLLVIYLSGFVYISIIWHLASVVSVLEEFYGLNAMAKSQGLIRGKTGISAATFLVLSLIFFGIQLGFEYFVVRGFGGGVTSRILYGILFVVLISALFLFGLVIQTIIYFVCKSYHHERIDKPSLADHLGGYLGEYVPLKAKDVQLEEFEA
ncbi:uncharacterized protein LOC111409513 [Olea europaea subsp. europaea]|uniref:Uncharacterized protein LOC111409513 n=1 Tax=Olea europaea subsp. europaea TaxID=158383 RepID=A0A8S0UCK7_OLEEU|nr:uncharacterized protein LOC111409513 [Olea europaea subsp. europaea]